MVDGSTLIDCDQVNCHNTEVNCPDNIDCHIDCSVGLCTQGTFNCPDHANCYINLGIGLQVIHINATSSLYFELTTDSSSLLENMDVYCPHNGHGGPTNICGFNANTITDSDIYTQEGFRDIDCAPTVSLSTTNIHCGATTTEFQCVSNVDGNACKSGNICNSDFLIPTTPITPSPTTLITTSNPTTSNPTTSNPSTSNPTTSDPTTVIHSFHPTTRQPTLSTTHTKEPSNHSTMDSTTYPTRDPTDDPTTNPSNTPSNNVITHNPTTTDSTLIALLLSTSVVSTNMNESLIANLSLAGYILLVLLSICAVILSWIGFRYHRNMNGCDSPNYVSIWRFCINVADLYTDFIFCIVLYLNNSIYLFVIGILFASISHVLSILIGLYFVHKWRENEYKMGYINKFDNVIIGLTILSGFYPAVSLLSSKLLHHPYTSLHLTISDKASIQQKRFMIHNMLENIPLIIIQIVAINKHPQMHEITLIALAFGVFSILYAILTFTSRICSIATTNCNESDDIALYKIDIISPDIKQHHLYSHKLTANAISNCLAIQSYRIETISMIYIVNGISCDIAIMLDDNEQKIDAVMNCLNDSTHNVYKNCKIVLSQCWDVNILKTICTKIDGSIIRLQSYNPPKVQLVNRKSISESQQIEGPKETVVYSDSSSDSEHSTVTKGEFDTKDT